MNASIPCDPLAVQPICVRVNGAAVPQASTPNGRDGWTYDAGNNGVSFGVNVVPGSTPVKTLGLSDFQIDSRMFALAVMEAYRNEVDGIDVARCKVRAVP